MYKGISKIKTLKEELDTLKTILAGITVKSPIDSSLLSGCKIRVDVAISTLNCMSKRINDVASLIYDDDEMFAYLFEKGLFFEDGELKIECMVDCNEREKRGKV